MKKLLFFLFFSLLFSNVLFAQEGGELLEIPEAAELPINVTVAPGKIVCLFFISAPSFVPKNEITIFQTLNVNCGNQPIEGNTSIKILDWAGMVVKEASRNMFLNRSLEKLPFYLYFSTSIVGTYTVVATTSWDNETLTINRTFDVVEAPYNVTVRIPLLVPLKVIIAAESIAPREINASRATTALVPITVANRGTIDLLNVTIRPVVPTGWNATPAYITRLRIDENVTRSVAIFPGREVMIAPHLILYEVIYENGTLQRGFFIANVRAEVGAAIKIEEYLPVFKIEQASIKNISFIVRNIGNITLTDIKFRMENERECLHPPRFPSMERLEVGKTSIVITELRAKDVVGTCTATLIVETREGVSDAVTIGIEVTSKVGIPVLIIRFLITNWWTWIIIIVLVILILRRITAIIYKKVGEEVTAA